MAPNPPHKRFFLSVLPISKRSIKDTSVRHRWKFPLGLAGLELALGLSYGIVYLMSASVMNTRSRSDHLLLMDDECRLCAY